jgi:hypothetical protein
MSWFPVGGPVQRGHLLLEDIETDMHTALPNTTVFTHLEPLDDPTSWNDVELDRATAAPPERGPVGDQPGRWTA